MNKFNHILFLLLIFSLSLFAQHRNSDVFKQLQCEEVDGVVYGFYYDLFHENYMKVTAPTLNGKLVQNAAMYSHLTSEKIYADSIDSSFTARNKVDFILRYTTDRLLDWSYLTDKNSLNTALNKWNTDIGKILTYGGSVSDRKTWQNRYLCVRSAIETINKANEPSGSRHEQYMDILNEIQLWHDRLKLYLMSLVCHRDLRRQYEIKDSLPVLQRSRIAIACQASRIIRLHDYALDKSPKKKNQ